MEPLEFVREEPEVLSSYKETYLMNQTFLTSVYILYIHEELSVLGRIIEFITKKKKLNVFSK